MMKLRQQQLQLEGTSILNISKKNALLFPNKRRIDSEGFLKEGFIDMTNYGATEYERDESPVSVISHSATIVSPPSSACTSMEHHLNHLISNPNRPRTANPNPQSPLSQSMGTSGASTSEDDSSANCNLPTLFIAVSPKDKDPSPHQAQEHVYSRNGLLRKSLTNKYHCDEEAFATKATSRSPHDSVVDHVTTGSFNTDNDEDRMISIDLQGLKEDPMVPRENFLKTYGNVMTDEEQKHAVSKFSGISKQYNGELKEEQCKLNRSTSNVQKGCLLVRPITNPLASKAVNQAELINNSRAGAALNATKHEEAPVKNSQKASDTTASFISRQRSVNYGKCAVPSKWDDAEKWLCYDNHHVSHQNKVKSSSISRQTSLASNHSSSSSGGRLISIKKQLSCKEDCASPSRGGPNINDKAFECRSDQSSPSSGGTHSVSKGHDYKDNAAPSILARPSVLQNTIATSGRGAQFSVDAASSRGNPGYASQCSGSNEMMEYRSHTYAYLDTLKSKRNGYLQPNACQKNMSEYMSSGEIANPHYALNRKLAAVSVSDGEISHQQVNCQQGCIASQISASTGSMPVGKWTKESVRPTSSSNWVRSNSDMFGTPCKCDYMSNGTEIMRTPNQQNVAAGVCASDGELCENYSSDQQSKSNASYAQRFKKHQILQKLRRKCSPRQGTSLCKADQEDMGEDIASTNSSLQKEFVVQTPTHGRSASMKDACTEVSPSLSRRDIGTQMTPTASSPVTSKCTSPLQNTSPARHNTPTRTSPTSRRQQGNDVNTSRDSDDEMNLRCNNVSAVALARGHWAKLELIEPPSGTQTSEKSGDLYNHEWSPAYGLEEEIVDSKDGDGDCEQDERHSGIINMKSVCALEGRATAWEEAERAKFNAKFKRKEARIKAWENLQKAKAEADLKKLEVKLEKLRSKATEKVMSRIAAAQKRAEEMRAAAEEQQAEHVRKSRERACSLRRNALFPGSFAVCFARNYMP